MKEKIARVLDKLLKRKVYRIVDVSYDPVSYNFGGLIESWGGLFGSKEAAEAELLDRGFTKVKCKVKQYHGWDVTPYMAVLWREKDNHCGGYFYAKIVEEDLKW